MIISRTISAGAGDFTNSAPSRSIITHYRQYINILQSIILKASDFNQNRCRFHQNNKARKGGHFSAPVGIGRSCSTYLPICLLLFILEIRHLFFLKWNHILGSGNHFSTGGRLILHLVIADSGC
jgi:hypothetical protein